MCERVAHWRWFEVYRRQLGIATFHKTALYHCWVGLQQSIDCNQSLYLLLFLSHKVCLCKVLYIAIDFLCTMSIFMSTSLVHFFKKFRVSYIIIVITTTTTIIIIIIIIIVIIIIIIIIPWELTPVSAGGLSLESEWQQVSSFFLDFSQYAGRPQQCCSLGSSTDFRLFQPP